MTNQNLIGALHDIGAVKFGKFKLKSGIMSPIYIDLRVTVSFPKLLQAIAAAMWEKIAKCDFDLICGVPYTALPIATAMSLAHEKPMVMRRKEVKDYGTKKAIEGVFRPGQTVLVVEDLVTSGSSVFETIEPLQREGLNVRDVVVLLDREQGGYKHVAERGYTLHAVLTISELLETLTSEGKLTAAVADDVHAFIREHQV